VPTLTPFWHFWTSSIKDRMCPLQKLVKKFWKTKIFYLPTAPNILKHVSGNTGIFLLTLLDWKNSDAYHTYLFHYTSKNMKGCPHFWFWYSRCNKITITFPAYSNGTWNDLDTNTSASENTNTFEKWKRMTTWENTYPNWTW